MKLSPVTFGLSSAFVVSICYTVCTIMAIVTPDMLLRVFNSMLLIVTIDQASLNTNISFTGYLVGIVQVFAYIFVIHWLFATTYNYMLAKGK